MFFFFTQDFNNISLKACGLIVISLCTMRCVSVCVRGNWFRVPCSDPSASVQSLGSEALRRYCQAKKLVEADRELEFSMHRCVCGELLHPEDKAEDVLQDNDFVQLGKGLKSCTCMIMMSELSYSSHILFVLKVFTEETDGHDTSQATMAAYPSYSCNQFNENKMLSHGFECVIFFYFRITVIAQYSKK